MNKVLNRPMFRAQALRKGYLKPIKANVGQMIGLPTGGSTVYNPSRLPAVSYTHLTLPTICSV